MSEPTSSRQLPLLSLPTMASLFARLKGKDKSKKKASDTSDILPTKPKWTDAWARTSVEPEEVHELIRCCTEELKARGMSCSIWLISLLAMPSVRQPANAPVSCRSS